MSDNHVTVKFVSDNPPPKYQTTGAAGCDVTSSEHKIIPAGKWEVVSTGLKMEIPHGYECQIRSRSGLAAKEGVFVLNGVGTIDSDSIFGQSAQEFIGDWVTVKLHDNLGEQIEVTGILESVLEKN